VPRCNRLNTCNNNTILLVTLQCYTTMLIIYFHLTIQL